MNLNLNPAAVIAGKLVLGTGLALGLLMTPNATVHAAPVGVDAYAYEETVNLSDIPEIDTLPVCELEDGSDSPVKPCVWTNDGNAWLTYEDRSFLVVDDTAVGPFAIDAGTYLGG